MTLDQAKQIYIKAAKWPTDHEDEEWAEIHAEMEQIIAAENPNEAAKIIEWWGCWDEHYKAKQFAIKVRSTYAKMTNPFLRTKPKPQQVYCLYDKSGEMLLGTFHDSLAGMHMALAQNTYGPTDEYRICRALLKYECDEEKQEDQVS